ncbi:putative NAD(P)H dehydrogenase (quinone) FQR1-like 2 [Smittium culicis]|uniref:Putative NAD(P)H dehydrogenase (Quinone) FQR1-like 2 n=1 Tax=Smittium culicis TaxID=133412 RepID=A0A1R1Y9L0_9FUNG|nr:putative NAD(P)H dehydrogenase (quinone) FQR1-like 2 [Smittium culicis]
MTKPTVYVVYYSINGHVRTVADNIIIGLKNNNNVNVELRQFEEILTEDVLAKLGATHRDTSVPTFTLAEIESGDAFLFGFPSRFGCAPFQVKSFFDKTGALWASQKLNGKMAGTFFSSGSQCGGQETVAYTFLPNLFHHGMIYVPVGSNQPNILPTDEVIGGSTYGAGTVAGYDASRQVSDAEKAYAVVQGEVFAKTVAKYYS